MRDSAIAAPHFGHLPLAGRLMDGIWHHDSFDFAAAETAAAAAVAAAATEAAVVVASTVAVRIQRSIGR